MDAKLMASGADNQAPGEPPNSAASASFNSPLHFSQTQQPDGQVHMIMGDESDGMVDAMFRLANEYPGFPKFLDDVARLSLKAAGVDGDPVVWVKRGRESCCDMRVKITVGVRL